MKISALAVATSLFGCANAVSEFNLRGFFGTEPMVSDIESMEGQVVVRGLLREVSDKDLDVIGDSVVTAYNKAFGPAGLAIKSFDVKSSAAFPDSVSSARCGGCRPDDDFSMLTTTLISVKLDVEDKKVR